MGEREKEKWTVESPGQVATNLHLSTNAFKEREKRNKKEEEPKGERERDTKGTATRTY